MFPMVENPKHVPRDPWFLTEDTAPFSLQSKDSGRLVEVSISRNFDSWWIGVAWGTINTFDLNSS